jgi:site-specific recombinase XerD
MYSEDRVKKIRQIKGRKWDATNKYWLIPYNKKTIDIFYNLFSNERIVLKNKYLEQLLSKKEQKMFINNYKAYQKILSVAQKELCIRGYSNKTSKAYLAQIRRFILFINKPADQFKEEDIKRYTAHLLKEKNVSHSYVNQAISAVKFFLKVVLNKEDISVKIPRPKKEKRLPDVLSQKEVMSILNSLDNLKHKLILTIIYSAGLRVGEVIKLKIEDFDMQ